MTEGRGSEALEGCGSSKPASCKVLVSAKQSPSLRSHRIIISESNLMQPMAPPNSLVNGARGANQIGPAVSVLEAVYM